MVAAAPLVTLIVPVRNEEAHIEACLRSLLAQDHPADRLECLVVDGDSDDRTASIVRRMAEVDARIRLLRNPRRAMPHGLNLGIAAAKGALVGVVNGHSALPPDYVSRLVRTVETTGAWSVGGRIVRVARSPIHRAIALATSSPVGVGDSRHNYADEAGWVETAFPGFWRRDVFDRVGPFDPEMLLNEDNELSHRIRKAGGGIWYDPSVAVEYVPRATLPALFRQYHGYARGKIRVLRKHGGGLRWRHAIPAGWVAWLVGGGAAALMASPLRPIWLIGTGLYAGVVLVASLRLRKPDTRWWLIAAAFVTLHLAYGLGTWGGLLEWLAPSARRT